jgi:hypothetical protein
MKSICVFCGSSDTIHADYLLRPASWGGLWPNEASVSSTAAVKQDLWARAADGVLEAGGEVIGMIIPTMNTLALAYIGSDPNGCYGRHARPQGSHA